MKRLAILIAASALMWQSAMGVESESGIATNIKSETTQSTIKAQPSSTKSDHVPYLQRPSKSADNRIGIKLNALAFIGIVNPAVEFRVFKNGTVQLEALGSFYNSNFLGTGRAFMLGAMYTEFRYYIKHAFDGFYFGPVIGSGVFKLNKGVLPQYADDYGPNYFQVGCNIMTGLSLGYQYNISRHWSVELSLSGGFQHTWYEGFKHNKLTGEYSNYVGLNKSAEWLPLFKGGLFVAYRF